MSYILVDGFFPRGNWVWSCTWIALVGGCDTWSFSPLESQWEPALRVTCSVLASYRAACFPDRFCLEMFSRPVASGMTWPRARTTVRARLQSRGCSPSNGWPAPLSQVGPSACYWLIPVSWVSRGGRDPLGTWGP